MSRAFHRDDDIEHIASAVCEAYLPEGIDLWWRRWIYADAPTRLRMELGVAEMWSGERPDEPEEGRP